MTKKYIAIIYEGEKTEKQLVGNLNKVFFTTNMELVPIMFPAGENIYMLWNQLKKDDFETDVIEVLRETNETAAKTLEGYSRRDFMEIYLFFDYDGHQKNLKSQYEMEDPLQEMLETFCEETELGKLYINYPMVESLRDNYPPEKEMCYRRCTINLSEIGDYKKTVHSIKDYQDFRKYTKAMWRDLCVKNISKLNCIIKNIYQMPQRRVLLEEMTQRELYEKQKEKYIKNGKIAVINSFPIFLYEYFKESIWEKV